MGVLLVEAQRHDACEYRLREYVGADFSVRPTPQARRALLAAAAEPGQVVADCFMGSGTTLRAAKDLGMRAIGIEISEEYCAIAVRRLAQGVLL